ncbi:MAG: type II restriction endonuclease subunit M [Xanthomonadaceae bacterium]|nr:type II restriction endonuclease subunit M [Xanthomonadaceae bacterium]
MCQAAAKWFPFAKGGRYSPFYSDIFLVVNWQNEGAEIKNNLNEKGNVRSNVWMLRDTAANYFKKPGLTWPSRAKRFSPQALPRNCLFSQRGYLAYFPHGDHDLGLGIFNSSAFDYLFKTALGRFGYPEFLVGILQIMPWVSVTHSQKETLCRLAHRAWSLKRTLDSIEETSHAFLLPAVLRVRLRDYEPPLIEAELACIQAEIDAIAFDLYGFSDSDRIAVQMSQGVTIESDAESGADVEEDEESVEPIDQTAGLLSWAVGVAFGRFDWRLATGERAAPPEPDPFDPLPAKSPGMLPDGADPFHAHAGILVDDQGHPHDLARLIEEVLARVDVTVPDDVRRWLQRDFFAFHLQRYSKSRRKAPIYWPLSTTSGSYTLWVYYPSLTSQTLYTAINDFVEPKLKQVGADVTALRNKGAARTRDDEKQFESLQAFELELIELRDTLLKLAPTYKPNHDDGVQISAAPLWPLFRHKPWQKVLKDTWEKLKKGDYDWAHLAMNYWPDRVREKCKTDKSLAIAHGLEDLYEEPEAKPKKTHGRKKGG